MGLDISAFNKLTEAPDAERDEDGGLVDYDSYRDFYINPDFPGHEQGLTKGMAYKLGDDSHGFRAGSYGGYNVWREELAELAGYPAGPYEKYGRTQQSHCVPCWNGAQGPFAEQINFSDCDGTIGPVVSAKLAKDYADFAAKAEAVGGYFWDKYREWRAAFDMAADGGAVVFH